jgi:sugar phosphate isomerase/epimerase
MFNLTRRRFLQSSGMIAAAGMFRVPEFPVAKTPKISFSTLGCPDWDLDKIIRFAVEHKYNGIEVRGILRELDLPKIPAFATDTAIRETTAKIKDVGLRIASMDSSAALHHKDQAERTKALDEAKRFIELAHKTGAPNVRVFPNSFPKEISKEEAMQLMTAGLSELGGVAKGSGVSVVMETHGDLVHAADVEAVISKADHQEAIGLVWDVSNMWNVTKESPALVYSKLKRWIKHIHLKDLKKVGDKEEYTLFGEGEVPVFEAIDLLMKDGFSGYYSFEWEKLWHPEIMEPEIAIAQFSKKMHEYFTQSRKA